MSPVPEDDAASARLTSLAVVYIYHKTGDELQREFSNIEENSIHIGCRYSSQSRAYVSSMRNLCFKHLLSTRCDAEGGPRRGLFDVAK